MNQIHLKRPGMSGRAVRYEVLSTKEVEAAESAAARAVTKESTMGEYNNEVTRLEMQMMIKSMTEPVKEADLPTAKWLPTSAQDLDMQWSKYFNVKDTAALKRICTDEHTVSQSDIDAIMEGKVVVLED